MGTAKGLRINNLCFGKKTSRYHIKTNTTLIIYYSLQQLIYVGGGLAIINVFICQPAYSQ
jgi:hypothetical protein